MTRRPESTSGGAESGGEAPAAFPLRVAAIDVGSNALRFAVAEFCAPRTYSLLASERVPVRLGHDVFLSGRLAPEAMDAAVTALVGFQRRIGALGVIRSRAVATSATRESSNGAEFVARVRNEAGVELETIGGSEEARLIHRAVTGTVALGRGSWLLVDLGGGSVEVSLVDETGILWSESHTMGSVRLLEELAETGEEPGRFARILAEYVSTLRVPEMARTQQLRGLVATGGNIEALARLAGFGGEERSSATLPVATVRSLIGTLTRLSYRDRVQALGLREDRADVILPAAMVYERLATGAGVTDLVVPFVGLREGILFDLVDDVTTHLAHEARGERESLQAAIALGRKYRFDEAHGLHVAELALSLFDQLAGPLSLPSTDRHVLQIAALLHDVGAFVSYKKHHKHSLYLLSQAELPGFTPQEMWVVANVARYHRRSEPGPQHDSFVRLDAADQDRVRRLAALLRVADALDREHLQRVVHATASVRGPVLEVRLSGSGDLLLERWAVQRKGGLCSDVFGLKVRTVAST